MLNERIHRLVKGQHMHHVYDIIRKRRTVRRFKPKSVPEELLLKLADAARLAPSASNIQPCEFILVNKPRKVSETFECIDWEQSAFPKGAPRLQERPTAYLVVLVDLIKKRKGGASDASAAAENAVLAAAELGLGTCWIVQMHRKRLKKHLRIPHHLTVDSVIAIGYPDETPVLEESQGTFKPWMDREGVVHVPKRRLADICTMNGYRHTVHETRKPA
jgi:nitroreductase